jgi:hypothetical protein
LTEKSNFVDQDAVNVQLESAQLAKMGSAMTQIQGLASSVTQDAQSVYHQTLPHVQAVFRAPIFQERVVSFAMPPA